MRKIVFIIIALFAISQNICAQGMTATLQSGDNLKVFYGIDAFKEAYEAAKDGDQITLSAGTFNSLDDAAPITKSIKITGVGAFGESNTTFPNALIVSGKDVRIEGVVLKIFYASGSTNLYVTRCWLGSFSANSNYTGAFFNESVFYYWIEGFQYADDFTFKNCTIRSFNFSTTIPKTNFGNFINCVIYDLSSQPYAIYKNNVIGYHFRQWLDNAPWEKQGTFNCLYPSEYYYNRFFSTTNYEVKFNYGSCLNEGNGSCYNMDTDAYPAKNSTKYGALPDGNDGTPVGIYGGSGFSPYPAIPRILSKSVDAYTNDEGKINVKIEVKAEQ